MVATHNIIDGRNAFALMDIFLGFLTSLLENTADYMSNLKWGKELVRLTPPAPFIHTIVANGILPDLEKAQSYTIENKEKKTLSLAQQLVRYFPFDIYYIQRVSEVLRLECVDI